MAAPENIKAGFLKERDVFAEQGIRYVAPFVSLDEPQLVPKQLCEGLRDVLPGSPSRRRRGAVDAGLPRARDVQQPALRARAREVLEWCAREDRPCLLVLARPYHMDPGIGHEIEVDLQAYGYPDPVGAVLPDRRRPDASGRSARTSAPATSRRRSTSGTCGRPPTAPTPTRSSGAPRSAARMPWVACVVRLASYECGMDQPTYTPVQQIVERSGTLFFSFQDLDSTKPAGSVKIRVETIAHYLDALRQDIIAEEEGGDAAGLPAGSGRARYDGRADIARPDQGGAASARRVKAQRTPPHDRGQPGWPESRPAPR